jgi:hypothetical protein
MLDRNTLIKLGAIMVITIVVASVIFKKKISNTLDMEVEKTWDSKTDDKIKKLHPQLRPIASKFINEVQKRLGHKLRITDGLRTFAEQDALYAKGRTTSGKIVTRAKGGQSYHNYGLAFDCYFTQDGKVTFAKAINADIAKIGKELGLEWGGSWTSFKDMPHFQLSKGKTSELLAKYNAGKKDADGYVIV